jgi:uncharacterized protein (TIGR00725 family)
MPKTVVGVMGPGAGASEADRRAAAELGTLIAREGWLLLTGGRAEGVMEAATKSAQKSGALTIGVLPSSDADAMSAGVDIPIITGIGEARNLINVLSSRVVFVCGMSAGTASEVALALKTQREVILIHPSQESLVFWISMDPQRVHVASEPAEAVEIARRLLRTAMAGSPE